MTPTKKSNCTSLPIVRVNLEPVKLSLWTSHSVAVDCGCRDSHSPKPNFTILVNGREVQGVRTTNKLETRLDLTEDHFGRRSKFRTVTVECQAKVGGQIVASTNKTIRRSNGRPTHQSLQSVERAPQPIVSYPFNAPS